MISAPKTISAIDRFCHEQFKDEHRVHLGASTIGEECDRKVFYKYRWVTKEVFEARMKRLFNRGHREEPAIIALLRGAGVTVYDAGESGELKAQMRVSDHNGHFGGTPDGVCVGVPDLPADEPCLLEMKTHNDKAYQTLVKDGVFASNPKYYAQMQIYMHKLDLKWALYAGINKNDDSLFLQLVQYNPAIATLHLSRARNIIYAKTLPPRISESSGFWKCRYCFARNVCHIDASPAENCRTCTHGSPSAISNPPGLWTCNRHREEITTQPEKGCKEYTANLNFFKDDIPF